MTAGSGGVSSASEGLLLPPMPQGIPWGEDGRRQPVWRAERQPLNGRGGKKNQNFKVYEL